MKDEEKYKKFEFKVNGEEEVWEVNAMYVASYKYMNTYTSKYNVIISCNSPKEENFEFIVFTDKHAFPSTKEIAKEFLSRVNNLSLEIMESKWETIETPEKLFKEEDDMGFGIFNVKTSDKN